VKRLTLTAAHLTTVIDMQDIHVSGLPESCTS
jgi:hypothetical protein